jgi:hypothetical protein
MPRCPESCRESARRGALYHHPKEAPTNLPNALWQTLAMEVTIFV